ncbi:MAG: P-II family nitrogen regulator [Rhizobiales bacterium]|nr:P-II family nitrogen regulator [Hyphomicrobiales bacterium]NRB13611.1 P-II family nitrogen regulator [Hyphomicrobiales bacterium]
MQFITAIVKPNKLVQVHEALVEIGVEGMTVTEVKGYGRQKGHSEIYRGAEYQVVFVPKIKIEIAASAELTDKIVDTIIAAAGTGKIGDGKIFVQDLNQTIRIRTSEKGQAAL